MGSWCIALEPQLGALWGPRWTGWGSGREIPRGVCILVADSLNCTAETNTILAYDMPQIEKFG